MTQPIEDKNACTENLIQNNHVPQAPMLVTLAPSKEVKKRGVDHSKRSVSDSCYLSYCEGEPECCVYALTCYENVVECCGSAFVCFGKGAMECCDGLCSGCV